MRKAPAPCPPDENGDTYSFVAEWFRESIPASEREIRSEVTKRAKRPFQDKPATGIEPRRAFRFGEAAACIYLARGKPPCYVSPRD